MKKAIVWFRNSTLRLADNPALHYAASGGYRCIFLYIHNSEHTIGSASKWFLYHALTSLENDILRYYNTKLMIKIGQEQEILQQLITEHNIDLLTYNKVYEPKEMLLDITLLQNLQCNIESFNGSLLFEPSCIQNKQGSFFKVFTPFWKKLASQFGEIPEIQSIPSHIDTDNVQSNTTAQNLNLLPMKPNWASDWNECYTTSEEQTHQMLDNFIQHKIGTYTDKRNIPSLDSTSHVSPNLHFGLISPRQIYYKLLPFLDNKSAEHFLMEICWREFAYYILYHFPSLPHKNFLTKFNQFLWQNNNEDLAKWQKGETGFPIIDAGMRELWQTGYMHNRVRMIVASFLTKNLLIDWRLGAAWFNDYLADADLASNSFAWQWVAGCGCDGAPYFRIFNPITQAQKFDKNAEYIKKWIPEIKNLSIKEIHATHNIAGYHKKMIDLSFSRKLALDLYKHL
ncbi:MAG: deoxyribodipyrimidine photo-lyase [Candidatus Deianiraeaceae bacterium]|jgi:deoxyribodipyrimidine photo-lyase